MGVARLHQLAIKRSEEAVTSGAMCPLPTRVERCSGPSAQGFELRHLIGSPPRHLRPAGPKPNPFLPWDRRLELERVGSHHVLILNKYPVQIGHMLLISRQWAPQTGWLTPLDWQAVHAVRKDSDGLWFFNSGPSAGASQPHRHLQLLPREVGESLCPRESWWETRLDATSEPSAGEPCTGDPLNVHTNAVALQTDSAEALYSSYLKLCRVQGIGSPDLDPSPLRPYNLLFCDRWMGLVSRRRDECHGFSVNALGFAGYLLSSEQSDRSWLDSHGPEALLIEVVPSANVRGSTDAVH